LWILDDTTPIAEWSASVKEAGAHLFSIRPATIRNFWKNTSYRGQASWAGENPPFGALISYHLGAPTDSVELVVRNPEDEVVRRLDGPTATGQIHRVTWDLTHEPPPTEDEEEDEGASGVVEPDTILPELEYPLEPKGPFVRPGTYSVTLHAGETVQTETVEVRGDSKIDLTAEQWRARESFLLDVLEAQRTAFHAAQRADSLHERLQSVVESRDASDKLAALADTAEARADELGDLQDDVYGLAGVFNWSYVTQPSLHPPTPTHRQRFERLQERLRTARKELKTLSEDADAVLE
ncbi:MAG: hypothetical protein ABEL51_05855, partial [Salinibacter sp.]